MWKNAETCEHVTDLRTPPPPFFFVFAQWDAINEMDEYFTPIHTYQVCIVLTLWWGRAWYGNHSINYFKDFIVVPKKELFFQLKQMGIIHQHNFLPVRLFDYMGRTALNNVNETVTLPQLRNFDLYNLYTLNHTC